MKKQFNRFVRFLQKDVGDESQSNDISVLVRILCFISIFFYIPQIFIIALNHNVILCMSMVLGCGLLVGALISTYENQIRLACILYCFVTVVLSAFLSLGLGVKLSYDIMLFITAWLVFYSLHVSNRFKRNYTAFVGILFFAVSIYYEFIPHRYEPGKTGSLFLLALNVTQVLFSIAVIGFSFCHKYLQSEEKILQYNKKLETLASTDALTSLWNRRAMNEHLAKLQSDYKRHQTEFSVAIMDIDFFKTVNDTYGHDMGDVVLVRLSEILRDHMESLGHVARWGGEEFLLTFEGISFDKAVVRMEELRAKVEQETFTDKDVSLNITITGGIEEFAYRSTLDSLLTKADEKLYKGKTSGRNQIVSSLY